MKNFICQGKQANKPDNNDGNNERYPVTPPIDNVRSYVEIKTRDNSSVIQQLVAEEGEQRKKMPSYRGLERYQILEKMRDSYFYVTYSDDQI